MTDIEEIENRLVKFRDERNWKQFHNLKDLALAVSVEAAELSELEGMEQQLRLSEASLEDIKNANPQPG